MIELDKNGQWWVNGYLYSPEQLSFYLKNQYEQDQQALQDRDDNIAALQAELAQAMAENAKLNEQVAHYLEAPNDRR